MWKIPVEPHAYVHDFVVTERHAVFLLPPLLWEPAGEGRSFLERHVWNAAPTRVLVVDKADPSRRRWLEMPTCFVFHFGNAWEDSDGTIRLDAFLYDDASILFDELREVMWGRWGRGGSPSRHARLTLHPTRSRVLEERGEGNGEFPRVDRRHTGRRYRYVYALTQKAAGEEERRHPLFDAVERRDLETGERRIWRYPSGVVPEEHLFVPRSPTAPEGEGWLIGTALDFDRAATQLCVFDAQAIEAGPLALARLPYPLPLGLHGAWRPGAA